MTRAELHAFIDAATDDEIRPVAYLASRIAAGRTQYGPLHLATDRRAWLEELRAELADAVAYLTWEGRR